MNKCEWCNDTVNSQGICVTCESRSLKAFRNELNELLHLHRIELVSIAETPTLRKNGVMMPIFQNEKMGELK